MIVATTATITAKSKSNKMLKSKLKPPFKIENMINESTQYTTPAITARKSNFSLEDFFKNSTTTNNEIALIISFK